MRILHLTLSPFPGPGASVVQIANMAQAFSELGHTVVVIAPTGARATSEAPGGGRDFGFTPAFEVRTLSRRIHRGQSYLHAARIARLASRGAPDLVFSRNLRASLLPALMGIPTVVEVHTLNALSGAQDRWVLRRLQRAAGLRGFVAISQGLADDMVGQLGIDAERILVAHDAVRLVDDAETVRAPSDPGTVTVGYTGSMFPGRGVEQLVALVEQEPRVTLHLVGGPQAAAEDWASAAPRAHGEGRLVIHGVVSPARARELQRGFDVLAAPFARHVSTDSGVDSSRWMSPMKVFEYMASGRPIIISDLPVLREVLRPDVDALMVPPEDLDALAAAVHRIADDPSLGERLASSALERVRREFTWHRRATTILERFAGPSPEGSTEGR
jgi:glycosyltransferase involved in cell wall biosynthesis